MTRVLILFLFIITLTLGWYVFFNKNNTKNTDSTVVNIKSTESSIVLEKNDEDLQGESFKKEVEENTIKKMVVETLESVPSEEKIKLAESQSVIICAEDVEVANVHAYSSDGKHTGPKSASPDSDLKFYEENIPNSQYVEFGSSSCVLLGSIDLYPYTEVYIETIVPIGRSGILIRQGNEDLYFYEEIRMISPWKGKILINQDYSMLPLEIDTNNDGKYEEVILPTHKP